MPLSKIKTNSVADEVFETGSNLIINGGMQVANGVRVLLATLVMAHTAYNLDRFNLGIRGGGYSDDTDQNDYSGQ